MYLLMYNFIAASSGVFIINSTYNVIYWKILFCFMEMYYEDIIS